MHAFFNLLPGKNVQLSRIQQEKMVNILNIPKINHSFSDFLF